MNDKRERTCYPVDPLSVCPGSNIEEGSASLRNPDEKNSSILLTFLAFHCFGGDSCCHPGNLCGEGHGDCDSDGDCGSGLYCGTDNCVGEGFETPQNSANPDDCCYRP